MASNGFVDGESQKPFEAVRLAENLARQKPIELRDDPLIRFPAGIGARFRGLISAGRRLFYAKKHSLSYGCNLIRKCKENE